MTGICHIRLLGAFALSRGDQSLRLGRRRSEAVLAYLALHPAGATRDGLVSALWPDTPLDEAKRTLRVLLADVRKTLGDVVVTTERDGLLLATDLLAAVDVQALDAITRDPAGVPTAELAEALERYAQPLLAPWDEAWLNAPRTLWRSRWVNAALHLIERWRAQADYAQAVALARQVLQAEPGQLAAFHHLLLCLSASGQKAQALEAFAHWQASDDGVVARDTLALVERIRRRNDDSARHSNLPRPVSSFIGREEVLDAIDAHLVARSASDQPARLLTLTGAGGSGKTRLAIQVASDLSHEFDDGVWWIELAALAHADDVLRQLARVLGVAESAQTPLGDAVGAALSAQHCLLILDNCEHLVAACAQLVADILAGSARVQILTTSRERLGVPGEQLFAVPTLSVPADETATDALARAMQSESVRLFVQRAQSVRPDFTLAAAQLPDLLFILRRVDGIPLAIELAAARLRSMDVAQLAQGLRQRFDLLVSAQRTVLPRQKTLHALIAWSHALLDVNERALFRRLAVFPGGCTLDAAQAVMPEADALLLVESLVDKSLVLSKHGAEGVRFAMLETIRHFAQEECASANELDSTQERALAHWCQWIDAIEQRFSGERDQPTLLRLRAEQDNLRTALDWALVHAPAQCVRLAGGLWSYWDVGDQSVEGGARLQQALAAGEASADAAHLARATSGAGTMAWKVGDLAQAAALHQLAAQRFRAIGDVAGEVFSQYNVAVQWLSMGEDAKAEAQAVQALELARSSGNRMVHSYALNLLGSIYSARSEFQPALDTFTESLQVYRDRNDVPGQARVFGNLGQLHRQVGRLDDARSYLLAGLERSQGGFVNSDIYSNLALVHLEEGQMDEALCLGAKALRIAHESGARTTVVDALDTLTLVSIQMHQLARATRWNAAATRLRKALDYADNLPFGNMAMFEQAIVVLKQTLSALDYDLAWQGGWHCPIDALVAEVQDCTAE
jgi:predicted ATPase/DNA-binding SARP family transcriptional activator